MRNFVLGAVMGALVMYWYLVHGDLLRETVSELWAQVSAPPPSARKAAP
jgi:hypothetical protein